MQVDAVVVLVLAFCACRVGKNSYVLGQNYGGEVFRRLGLIVDVTDALFVVALAALNDKVEDLWATACRLLIWTLSVSFIEARCYSLVVDRTSCVKTLRST